MFAARATGSSWAGWLFLLPALLFFGGWMLYPLVQVGWLSFTNFHYLRPDLELQGVGLDNYVRALSDPLVLRGLARALGFAILFVPGMIVLPVIVAVLVHRVHNERLQRIYRLLLLVPAMIPGPLVFLLWTWMYNPTIGPINYILVDVLGLFTIHDAPRWTGDPPLLFPAVSVVHWWWGLGLNTMLLLVGLQGISGELIDAARVDGASEWRVFWHVLLPRLRPILLVLIIIRFGAAGAVIEEFLIFGGLNRELPTYTWAVYMWDVGFRIGDLNQAYAAAIGWIGALLMLTIVGLLFWVLRPRD
jgi:multiple sugar transport system permease protein